jgi:hypothetical protein
LLGIIKQTKAMRMKNGYWKVVAYPLALWLAFYVVAFVFGYTDFPDTAKDMLLGNAIPATIAFLFGLWIGIESSVYDFSFAENFLAALVVAFTVGVIVVLMTVTLINTSHIFLTYSLASYSSVAGVLNEPLLNLAISTWIEDGFTALIASVVSFSLLSRILKKR